MTTDYILTPEQEATLADLRARWKDLVTVGPGFCGEYFVRSGQLLIGIERDGHAHS